MTSDFDCAKHDGGEFKDDAARYCSKRTEGACVRCPNSHDLKFYTDAAQAANRLCSATGEDWLACDRGRNVSPRYGVVRAPKIGDEVSYAFNGDSYPCGKVVKVSASFRRVETDSGEIFWRRRESASWIYNGTWSLVRGHVNKRNPEF